jgi:ankyrin repeat protein
MFVLCFGFDAYYRHSGTPLHSAALGNNVDVFKALLDAKADIHAKDA